MRLKIIKDYFLGDVLFFFTLSRYIKFNNSENIRLKPNLDLSTFSIKSESQLTVIN